jgi:calpain-7
VNKGDFILEQALLLDEAGKTTDALSLYLKAVDAYLEDKKAGILPAEMGATVNKRLHDIVSRCEEIKAANLKLLMPDAPTSAEKAPGGVPPSKAAAAPSVPTPPPGKSNPPSQAVAKKPSTGSNLSKEELDVLRRSSTINGKIHFPWLDVDLQEQFVYPSKFNDPDGLLRLSADQLGTTVVGRGKNVGDKFESWKRPYQITPGTPVMISQISAYSITQDVIGDCSFVSSLCIGAAYERKFNKQLITSIIYPQNRKGQPVYNPSGKYMVKLHFNGIPRKIIVDDLLPVDKSDNLICARSTNKDELWVSIIEKAYMKVNGGFDFPGSNSGIDMYALTGWIPEQLHFSDKNFDPERTWNRIYSGSKYGDCLLTIATGPMPEEDEDRCGLVGSHAYAVLQVWEGLGLRLLQIKNPWARRRWKGSYSCEDRVNWTEELKTALNFDQNAAMNNDNGIFWIDYKSVLAFFCAVYMNWNPSLFTYNKCIHGGWPLSAPGPKIDTYNIGYNPQYRLVVDSRSSPAGKSSAVWILLSRHVTSHMVGDGSGYLTIHVYNSVGDGGGRVYYPHDAKIRSTYTNNPHTLVRFDVPPGLFKFQLVLSQYERCFDVDYTLNVYCMSPIGLERVPFTLPYCLPGVKGVWDEVSAGGNGRYPTFMNNPQWRITLDKPAVLHIRVEAPVKFNVNLRLVADGDRVSFIEKASEVASSGDYRVGLCYIEKKIPPGMYTLVVSTFDPGCIGNFVIYFESSELLASVTEIAQEGCKYYYFSLGSFSVNDV